MKKFLLLTVIFSSLAFGQEIKMKKGIITVDDKEWAKYDGCGIFDQECSITKGDSEVVLAYHEVYDIAKRQPSNPKGSVSWVEVKLLGTKKSFEYEGTPKNVAKVLYKNNIFNEDGSFNEEKIDLLVEKYGMPFSAQYYQNSPNQTIIINNKEEQPAPSGINIKIGK